MPNLYFIKRYKHYTEDKLKQQPEEENSKTVEYIIPTMDKCPRNQ